MTSPSTAAFLARRHGHWIDGAAVPEGSEGEIVVLDPATEAPIARIAAGGQAEVDQAVAAARRALNGPWGDMPHDERTRILLAFAALAEQHAGTITELAVLDNGMPWAIAESCAPFCAMFLRYYAGWISKISGQTLPSAALGKKPSQLHAYTQREPIGVVGAITPWNYPFGMEMLKIAPVLATGCTLVLKPAEDAPLAALLLAELASEAGVPPGVFNVVNGIGESAGAAVAAHEGIDKVAFTGSTEVGRHIVHAAAGNLKKVSLELGGKSPVLVYPDANLETAIPGVALAAFMLQGQNCVCGSRVFAHVSIAEQLARGVAEFAASLNIGPGTDPKNMIGPLISARQRDRVEGFFSSAAEEGARCMGGGARVGERGYFVAPTVYTDCTPEMRIVREEIFGPVMAIQTFDRETPEELAARANDTNYGLSASIWTQDLRTAHTMSRLIDAGQVGVNCHAAMDPSMPFGGFKQSGWGREFGADALELYLRTKAVTMAWD
ncbi:MAG: aldehyde dehydrogenase family protein [Gammaproteobacteria bacterium]|nr:MAG: aldehyde dehydrogenase family protein [Gammaproteobacteria bacterium]